MPDVQCLKAIVAYILSVGSSLCRRVNLDYIILF